MAIDGCWNIHMYFYIHRCPTLVCHLVINLLQRHCKKIKLVMNIKVIVTTNFDSTLFDSYTYTITWTLSQWPKFSGPEFSFVVEVDGRGCPREPDGGHAQLLQPLPRQEVVGEEARPQPRSEVVGGGVHSGRYFFFFYEPPPLEWVG